MALHLLSKSNKSNRENISFGVIENSFTSIVDLAKLMTRVPSWIPDRLFCGIATSFHSLTRVFDIKVPMLFLSGSLDDIVPETMMRRLYENCPVRAKRLVSFGSSGHVDTWMAKGYMEAWRAFATDVLGGTNELETFGNYLNNNGEKEKLDQMHHVVDVICEI